MAVLVLRKCMCKIPCVALHTGAIHSSRFLLALALQHGWYFQPFVPFYIPFTGFTDTTYFFCSINLHACSASFCSSLFFIVPFQARGCVKHLGECQFLVHFNKKQCDCFVLFHFQPKQIVPSHKGVCVILGHYQHYLFNVHFCC